MGFFKRALQYLLGAEAEFIGATGGEMFAHFGSLLKPPASIDEVGSMGGRTQSLAQVVQLAMGGKFSTLAENYWTELTQEGVPGQRLMYFLGLKGASKLVEKSTWFRGKTDTEKLLQLLGVQT